METTRIKLKDLELNTGQVDGLPRNPRQWSKGDVQRLAKSITETPELLEARPLIAIPCKGRYVVLGGNLRLEALRSLKWAEAPVYLLPENTTLEKQREIVIKDNGSFVSGTTTLWRTNGRSLFMIGGLMWGRMLTRRSRG